MRLRSVAFPLALAACSAREGAREIPATSSTAAPPSASAAPAVTAAAPTPSGSAGPPAAAPEGMAVVPAGPFTMGADQGGEEDEHPAHTVTIGAFYLDLTEVTNEAWDRCVAAQACPPPDPT